MARGVSIGGTYFTVTSFSANINRNPLMEESFTSSAATKVYGGAYSVSGSFEAIYRVASNGPLTNIVNAIANGTVPGAQDIILIDDAGNNMTFGSCCINSAELNISSKEFVRITYNFIGQYAKKAGSVTAPTGAQGNVGVFYSTVLNMGTTYVKATGATLRLEVPIDQDYFVLGSQYIQGYLQSGLAAVEGTLTLGSDADLSYVAEDGDSQLIEPNASHTNSISGKKVELKIGSSAGGTLTTITIPVAKVTTADMGAQGRNKFDKSVTFVGEFDGTSNNMTITNA